MRNRVLLSLTFLLCLAHGIQAWDGSGTADSPYILANAEDWAKFATNVNDGTYADKHFKLADTWDNSAASVTATVGTEQHPFEGTFDGNGKTLNVSIYNVETQGTAPFCNVKGATIKNLTVKGSVTGTLHAAGLVGFVRAGDMTKVDGCTVNTTVNNSTGNGKGYIGGVVGHGTTATIVIRNTVFSGDLKSNSDYTGGLQGWSDGNTLTITNSFFLGTHSGSNLFHPIALHNKGMTTQYTNNGAYYISTSVVTVMDQSLIAATGKPIYSESMENYGKITAPDGKTYYVESVFYNVRSWDEENNKVVTTSTPCPAYIVLEGKHRDDWLGLGSADDQDDYYYVVKGEVSYKTLNVFGNVHLILTDGSKIYCSGGIKVEKQNNNATLNIYSQSDGDNQGVAEIRNTNYNESACIGSAAGIEPGKLIFHGGNFTYYAVGSGAAIGGGENSSGGEMTFYGGNYKLTATQKAAAIGGGGGSEPSNGGTIKIYGGTFDLKGADYAAVIGGGYKGNSGTIDIYGGEITAKALKGGSGIGHGSECTTTQEGHINIHGGKVTAKGEGQMARVPVPIISFGMGKFSGAGIGGADESPGGNITISGGVVDATAGYFASAIGGGYNSSGGNITISGGIVTTHQQRGRMSDIAATRTDTGAGIGGGENGHGGTITITGGEVTAEGGEDAAAIGGGEGGDSGDITISGGNITATTYDYGSAIGAGEDGKVNSIQLLGGTINAEVGDDQYGWAVGSEEEPESGTITIGDNMMVTSERTFTAAERVGGCRWRKKVTIEPCSHTPKNDDALDIVYTYDILNDIYHLKHCRYCNVTFEEEHTGEDCVCGMKSTNQFCLYVPDAENNTYKLESTITIGVGKEFYLPSCSTVPNNYTFIGWEKNPQNENSWAAVLGSGESSDNIIPAGKSVTALLGQEEVHFFARYLYVFEDAWTWSDDASSVSVTLCHPDLEDVTLSSTDSDPQMTIKSTDLYEYVETEGEDGTMVLEPVKTGTHYTATVNYILNGYTYKFTDTKDVMLPEETPEETVQELELSNNDDNTDLLADNDGMKANVTLSGRTLYKDGSWNTLCLPFDVADLKGTPLEGATVKTLASSEFDSSTSTLTLYFGDSRHTISAGTPYIVKWTTTGENIVNPVFDDVVIANNAVTVGSPYVDFVGIFSPVGLEQDNRSVLYLGSSNKLYYPNKDMNVNACRAYFELHNGLTAADLNSAGAQHFVLNFSDNEDPEITGIIEVATPTSSSAGERQSSAWYSLDGRQLSGKPTHKGIYIHHGKKQVVK